MTDRDRRLGFLFGVIAYSWWGLLPLYIKAVSRVPALEILSHRVVWAFGLLCVMVVLLRRGGEVMRLLQSRRTAGPLVGSSALIALNWFVYIIAVRTDRVTDASLGYFINPLMNVLLGVAVLGERLRRPQMVAVALAAAGVAVQVWARGELPWISLTLASTFAAYGLIRKTTHAGALEGLTIETMLLSAFGGAYLAWITSQGQGWFLGPSTTITVLICFSGVMTALPLWSFAAAARRLPYATVGLLQYIAPTLAFLLAVFVFGEPISALKWASFALIWVGLAVFSADALRESQRPATPPNEPPAPPSA